MKNHKALSPVTFIPVLGLIVALILAVSLVGFGSFSAEAQGFAPNPTPTQPPRDMDGDGVPDKDDLCPTVPGPASNQGCPVPDTPAPPPPADRPSDQPPADNPPPSHHDPNPDPGQPTFQTPEPTRPPFVPPALPDDGCYVTPLVDNNINVREQPDLAANVIGWLLPGKVYPALGYVMIGTDIWFVLAEYENSTGTIGYGSRTVLTATNCPQIARPFDSSADDRPVDTESAGTGGQPQLCHLTVGYDAPTWGGSSSFEYAAVYFAAAPGAPLPAGLQVWGVMYVAEFLSLPDSLLKFTNAESAVTVAPSQAVVEIAQAGGIGTAANMGWPTANGGLQSGEMTLYRLTGDSDKAGACGPIAGIGDLISVADPSSDPLAMQCASQNGKSTVAVCWCETADTECVDQLVSICWGGDAYIDAGPQNTACWWVDEVEVGTHLVTHIPDARKPRPDWHDIFGDFLYCLPGTVWWDHFQEPTHPDSRPMPCYNRLDALPEGLELPPGSTILVVMVDEDTPISLGAFALNTGTVEPAAGDGPEEFELDFLWEQCPEGWVWYNDIGLVCEPLLIED